MWGGQAISPGGVLKVQHRHWIGTSQQPLSRVVGYASPPEPEPTPALPEPHLEACQAGGLVKLDCFRIGRLTGTNVRVWRYTAIYVSSSYTWASAQVRPLNPLARSASALVPRLAQEVAEAG